MGPKVVINGTEYVVQDNDKHEQYYCSPLEYSLLIPVAGATFAVLVCEAMFSNSEKYLTVVYLGPCQTIMGLYCENE